jgi:hypothetical protein
MNGKKEFRRSRGRGSGEELVCVEGTFEAVDGDAIPFVTLVDVVEEKASSTEASSSSTEASTTEMWAYATGA